MNPRDLLERADELCGGMREVDWRDAATRAYFAAFHVARLFFRHLAFDVPNGTQAHAYLWLRLSNCGHPDLVEGGRRLNDLRATRNWAEYDLDQFFPHRAGFNQVQGAMDIIQLLDAAVATPTSLPAIRDAIRVYERDVLRQVTWRP
jgi:hypothetical protein